MAIEETRPARWPYCEIEWNGTTYPAVVGRWERISDANGYLHWYARVVIWDGEKAVELAVPTAKVTKVGD